MSARIVFLAGASLMGAVAMTWCSAALGLGGPALRLRAFDAGTGERFVLTLTWESWPSHTDPARRCQQAALYLGGEIGRRMAVESVACGE